MKELSIEEKAKAYDEAVINGSRLWESDVITRESYEYIFPELKESEDEKIRNWLISTLKSLNSTAIHIDGAYEMMLPAIAWLEKQGKSNMGISEATKQKLEDNLNKALQKETPESYNEFLEKQGEQKPAEYTLEQAAGIFLDALSNTPYNNKPITDAQVITKELLKFLSDACSYNPNAINEQNTAWSEEDELMRNNIIRLLVRISANTRTDSTSPNFSYPREIEWLKSLKERYTWKPSDEQMKCLSAAIEESNENSVLESLLSDLKKLRENNV